MHIGNFILDLELKVFLIFFVRKVCLVLKVRTNQL